MREMELISTNGDVIDSLKQANPAQLILHSFPGQVALKEREREKPHSLSSFSFFFLFPLSFSSLSFLYLI